MLPHTTYEFDHIWNRLQEPARPTAKPADYLLLLSALDDGWKIVETAHYVPFNDLRGGMYMLTLFHPTRLLTQQTLVARTREVDALINEDMTVINYFPGACPPEVN